MSSILNDNCDDLNFDNSKVISQIIIQSNHLAKNQETNGSDYLSLPLLILKRLKNIWKPTILKNNGI